MSDRAGVEAHDLMMIAKMKALSASATILDADCMGDPKLAWMVDQLSDSAVSMAGAAERWLEMLATFDEAREARRHGG